MVKFLRYVFPFFIFFGCSAATRTRLLLHDAESDLKQAEIYRAKEFTPYEWSVAKGRIETASRLLELNRDKEALVLAQEAKDRADDALRISLKSVAAISIKNAGDARKLVEENEAFHENEDLYQKMLSETQNAENAFLADRFDVCIKYSEKAVTHAGILLEPMKKEAEILRERVSSAWGGPGNREKQTKKLEALIGEGEEAIQARQFKRAISILKKVEMELQSFDD